MQGLQTSSGLAVRQALQIGSCLLQRLAGSGFLRAGLLDLLLSTAEVFAPATLRLEGRLLRLQSRFLHRSIAPLLLQLAALLGAEQFNAVGAGAQLVQRAANFTGALEDALGNQAVDLRAGELLQQFRALVGVGLEEGGEPALGQ